MRGSCLIHESSSLENHFPAGLPVCCAPVWSLTGSTQEHFYRDGEAWWSHGWTPGSKTTAAGAPHTGTLAEGTPAPWDPSGCQCIREWGGFRGNRGSGHHCPSLPSNPSCGCSCTPQFPQLLFLQPAPAPSSEPLGCGRGLGFSDGLCISEELCSAFPEVESPEVDVRDFWGVLAIKPCEGLKTNQHWLISQRGLWRLRMDPAPSRNRGDGSGQCR